MIKLVQISAKSNWSGLDQFLRYNGDELYQIWEDIAPLSAFRNLFKMCGILLRFGTRVPERTNSDQFLAPCKTYGRGGRNFSILRKVPALKKGQSSMLQVDALDFRHIVPFWNQSLSHATDVENRGRISHFLTFVKFRGGLNEMYKWILPVHCLPTFASLN